MSQAGKTEKTAKFSTLNLAITAMMAALTILLMTTPLGTISLPFVSITIAHVPAILTAIVFGWRQGLAVAFVLGATSLLSAIAAPATVLDPFFVNPLISVLPRLLIPITAYSSYKALEKALRKRKMGRSLAVATAAAVGNLTNTFGVYTMLYLLYARQILEKTGQDALQYILAAISTTTLIKCVGIVIISLPIVLALDKVKNKRHTR